MCVFVEYLATMLPCVLMSLNCPYLILFVSVCRNSSVDTSNTEAGQKYRNGEASWTKVVLKIFY